MALGRAIVRQLDLDDRAAVLDRWLAHHVAELIARADEATGPDKAAVEGEAVELILKLWANRRALPVGADPLGGYREAVATLGVLMPEANPWARHRASGTDQDLLRDLFEATCRVVMAGLLLTTSAQNRPPPAEMVERLEPEERLLLSALDRWTALCAAPRAPAAGIASADPTVVTASENSGCDGGSGTEAEGQGHEGGELPTESDLRAMVAESLAGLHDDVGQLLTRWKARAEKEAAAVSAETDDASA